MLAIANNNCDVMTLYQIGTRMNLTRMRVCQIEKRAIEKMKSDFYDFEDFAEDLDDLEDDS